MVHGCVENTRLRVFVLAWLAKFLAAAPEAFALRAALEATTTAL